MQITNFIVIDRNNTNFSFIIFLHELVLYWEFVFNFIPCMVVFFVKTHKQNHLNLYKTASILSSSLNTYLLCNIHIEEAKQSYIIQGRFLNKKVYITKCLLIICNTICKYKFNRFYTQKLYNLFWDKDTFVLNEIQILF